MLFKLEVMDRLSHPLYDRFIQRLPDLIQASDAVLESQFCNYSCRCIEIHTTGWSTSQMGPFCWQGFLERLRLEQGAIDLEWLRSIPSEDAK